MKAPLLGTGLLALAGVLAAACSSGTSDVKPKEDREALGQSVSLLFEGTCQFLACNSSYSADCSPYSDQGCYYCGTGSTGYKQARLACGNTICSDNLVYLVSPYRSCNSTYVVCYGGRNVTATVLDSADYNHQWEASSELLSALGAPWGTIPATLYTPGDPSIADDPTCGFAPPPPPPPPPPPCQTCQTPGCYTDTHCGSPVACFGACPSGYSCTDGTCTQAQSCIAFGQCGWALDSCGQWKYMGDCPYPQNCVQNSCECQGTADGCHDACGTPYPDGTDCFYSPLNEEGRCLYGSCVSGT